VPSKSKKSGPPPEKRCGFCGRPASQTPRLFKGSEALICEDCVQICIEAITAEKNQSTELDFKLPRPSEIKEFLDKYVIGQEKAKKIISGPLRPADVSFDPTNLPRKIRAKK